MRKKNMIKFDISLRTGEVIEIATIEIHRQESSLTFIRGNGFRKTYTDHDLYLCLAQVRQEFPEIQFLCKGAKINVFPSRMCSQMSGGIVAYELISGRTGTFDQIVNIFDFEDKNITHDIRAQKDFYRRWLNSFE
ncbi:hypothetical protein [Pseudomonas sp. EL_65y_Pfl2_R96]|uniref:hypothetical protein n=1 Tax=Pseudomonas sp. EL_65y_Pfl2_R96 TaxID=3088699 RepID=UPI0030D8997F